MQFNSILSESHFPSLVSFWCLITAATINNVPFLGSAMHLRSPSFCLHPVLYAKYSFSPSPFVSHSTSNTSFVRFSSGASQTSKLSSPSSLLLMHYIDTYNIEIFRIWFLLHSTYLNSSFYRRDEINVILELCVFPVWVPSIKLLVFQGSFSFLQYLTLCHAYNVFKKYLFN